MGEVYELIWIQLSRNRTRVLKNNVRLTLAAKDGRDLGYVVMMC